MPNETNPPKFLSLEFHVRFFPRLVWNRLRLRKKADRGTTFTSNMEMTIVAAVCLILVVIGAPSVLNRGSVVGWILTILGAGGIVVLLAINVLASWGRRPVYDDFLTGIFFLTVFLGIMGGTALGWGDHTRWLALFGGIGGFFAGYVLGIFAGLWLQYLGTIAVIVNMLSGLAAIMIALTGFIMLLLPLI